jgi:hypothetical protein
VAEYKLVVMSDAVEGQEADYNEWYNNQHLADVVAVPGFTGASRFKLRSVPMGQCGNQYMAIYDVESDDPEKAFENLASLMGTPALPISPALNMANISVAIFEPCSEQVTSAAKLAAE